MVLYSPKQTTKTAFAFSSAPGLVIIDIINVRLQPISFLCTLYGTVIGAGLKTNYGKIIIPPLFEFIIIC